MLAKGQRPIIGRLSELLVSRCRPAFLDMGGGATSPTNHFDLNLMLSPSPRGNNLRNYNGGGVGLGIVAALDNSSAIFGREILVKHAVCSPKANSGRAIQIPGISSSADEEEIENMEEENYTYVTTRGPHRSSTRVYYDGGVNSQSGVVGRAAVCGDSYSFQISPSTPAAPENPTPGFLRSCHSCRKNLDGNDIYMYSEKAFCSPECRSKEIRKDEKKERCGSEAVTRSTVVSESPIFSTGILAI